METDTGDFKYSDSADKWLSSGSKLLATGFNFFSNLYRFPQASVL